MMTPTLSLNWCRWSKTSLSSGVVQTFRNKIQGPFYTANPLFWIRCENNHLSHLYHVLDVYFITRSWRCISLYIVLSTVHSSWSWWWYFRPLNIVSRELISAKINLFLPNWTVADVHDVRGITAHRSMGLKTGELLNSVAFIDVYIQSTMQCSWCKLYRYSTRGVISVPLLRSLLTRLEQVFVRCYIHRRDELWDLTEV